MAKIELISQKTDYDKYIKIEEGIFKEISESGEEFNFSRFAVVRPDAVAVLVYNSDRDTVILVKQHRFPIQVRGVDGNIYEIPAGKIDGSEDSRETAKREVKEEIGYDISDENMRFMSEFYPSPGYSSEVIYLYAVTVTDADKTSKGGGVEGEHENIDIHEVSATNFFNMIAVGEIKDCKTIMGANAFWHLRNDQFVQLGMKYAEILRLENARKIADEVIGENEDEDSK